METKKVRIRKKLQKNRIAFISITLGILVIAILGFILISNNSKVVNPTITHLPSSTTLNIEIADNDEERAKGLMGRKDLEENFAMLFVYPDSKRRSFWMLNTPERLDIIFLDKDMKVINYYLNTIPNQTSTNYSSRRPAMYVIEAKAGFVKRAQIKALDQFSVNGI